MFIAQFNVSIERAPLEDPSMAEFMSSLAPVNRSADESEGFVWRLHDESGNATAMRVFDDRRIIFNLSVWKSVEQLKQFVYRAGHMRVLRKRREWFHVPKEPSYVLWWVPESHRPTIEEAKARLQHLREHGPSPEAFTFDSVFAPSEGAPA